ncbi:N-acetyltransferase [Nemorincola caseinilytica]
MNALIIEKLGPGDDMPFGLLLLADETTEAIEKYIYTSDVYVARQDKAGKPIAVFVLQQQGHAEMELKNIAVSISFQEMGIGSYLVGKIKEIAAQAGCTTLWVGTPDIATKEIGFYKRNGFAEAGTRKDFYIENYPDPLYDNGVQLRDMAMLRMVLP